LNAHAPIAHIDMAAATTTTMYAAAPPAHATPAAARRHHRSHRPTASPPSIINRNRRGATKHTTNNVIRGPSPPSAVPQDGDKDATDDAAPSLGGMLGGGLADALGAADGERWDAEMRGGDQVADALGMRESLLGDANEAKARAAAMTNLGLLMASGQAGALNNISPDLLPLLLRWGAVQVESSLPMALKAPGSNMVPTLELVM
jgi:hypothetical protein